VEPSALRWGVSVPTRNATQVTAMGIPGRGQST
jgi:hypothetical protein